MIDQYTAIFNHSCSVAHSFCLILLIICLIHLYFFRVYVSLQDKFLKLIGDRHPNIEFFQSLSLKCMFNIFSSEHVRCILDNLSAKRLQKKGLEASSIDLLLVRRISAERG